VNRGCNHSADHGSSNRFHYVRTDTTCPQDRYQAGENSTDRHQFWPEAMHRTLDGGLINVGFCKRATCGIAVETGVVMVLHVLTPGQMFSFWAETQETQVSVFTQL
jgi:hypothetical protein